MKILRRLRRRGIPRNALFIALVFALRPLGGDSHTRARTVNALTPADRYIVNKIAANQAQIEVAYATAHALADLGRADEARRQAGRGRGPGGTLRGGGRA